MTKRQKLREASSGNGFSLSESDGIRFLQVRGLFRSKMKSGFILITLRREGHHDQAERHKGRAGTQKDERCNQHAAFASNNSATTGI